MSITEIENMVKLEAANSKLKIENDMLRSLLIEKELKNGFLKEELNFSKTEIEELKTEILEIKNN